jgi:hypothetical protein
MSKVLIQNLSFKEHYRESVNDEGFKVSYQEGYIITGQIYDDLGTADMVSIDVYETQDQAMAFIEEIQDTEVDERDWLCVSSRSNEEIPYWGTQEFAWRERNGLL